MIKVLFTSFFISYSLVSLAQQASKEIYKDTLGNVITADAFKEKIKTGKYSTLYSVANDSTTFFLVNRKKAEKEAADQLNAFKNKLKGMAFPDFKLKKVDGTEVDRSSLMGKTVVVNFWFIGCKPCIAEMPLLNEVVTHYKGKPDVVFLAPALDPQEKLALFLTGRSFLYQVLTSSEELARNMDISSFPTHIIVDSAGLIREVMVGGREDIDKRLIEAIDKVAAK